MKLDLSPWFVQKASNHPMANMQKKPKTYEILSSHIIIVYPNLQRSFRLRMCLWLFSNLHIIALPLKGKMFNIDLFL
jgi:hypothetical protein